MVTERKRGMRMQDRYLFRAKRLDNGEWVQGCYIYDIDRDSSESLNEFAHRIQPLYAHAYAEPVNQSTICQCTGLKDKNGNLIWENDIVAYWDSYSTESGLAEADCIGKVVWDDETISFQVTNRLSAESYEVLGDECSVIGKVFDNPELLEE